MAFSTQAPAIGVTREALNAAWAQFAQENQDVTMRDGARTLGSSEAQILNACSGDGTTRLSSDFQGLIEGVRSFGRIMSLVRNDDVIIMPVGTIKELSFRGANGHMRTDTADFTFDLSKWGSVFGIVRESHDSIRRMLHFFDECGEAALKIVVWSKEGEAPFDALLEKFAVNPTELDVVPATDPGWQSSAGEHYHETLAGEMPARVREFLKACVEAQLDFELTVPTRSSIEIYRGPLRTFEQRDDLGNHVDLRYPRFTSHFTVGSVRTCGFSGGDVPALTMLDDQARKMFKIRLLDDKNAEQSKTWRSAISEKLRG